MAASIVSSRLNLKNTVLFICDIQDKFRPLIYKSELLISNTKFLYDATRIMEVPCVVTEHYSKALGNTVPDINIMPDLDYNTTVFQKRLFSMMTPEVVAHLNRQTHSKVLLTGIESHVCVLQTAMDLIASGYQVHVACDAISSQRKYDRKIAIERLAAMGATLTTTESAIFELMETSQYPKFKEVSGLIKEHNLHRIDDEFD